MTRPLVSAVMPAYNAEAFLVPAIESALAQDYSPFELVVCDDGSTDATAEILSRYPVAKVVRQENRGRAAACNAAIAASSGEFIAAFDADDEYPPERLRLQATYLIDHPETGVVLGRQEWMNPPAWLGRDAVFGDLDGIPIGSAMIRRSVLETLGGYNEKFRHGEDMDLMVRMRAAGVQMHILDAVIWHRRYHEGQMTANAPAVNPLLRSLREKLASQRGEQVSR